jgi:hypothetical protein
MTSLQSALKNLIIAMAVYGKEMKWNKKDVLSALEDIGISEDEVEVCNVDIEDWLGKKVGI